MTLQSTVPKAYEALREIDHSINIVLFDYQSRFRSLVVAKLLVECPLPVFYYAMGPYDVNITSFLANFSHDLAEQHPTFGRNLNQLGIETLSPSSDDLKASLLMDLAELSDEPFYLILDEYDAAEDAHDIQEFLESLLEDIPHHCQVIINSRTLPRMPWTALLAKNEAVILRDTERVTSDIYGFEREKKFTVMNVQALGPGLILKEGEFIEDWEGHLPRLLFLFVLERPQVTRREICEAFWSDLELEQAVNVFHVTKRRLHKSLGFDALVHVNGYYQINPDVEIQYDISELVEALGKGRTSSGKEAQDAWQRVIDLYRGPYLQGHTEAWILRQREAYDRAYTEAMIAVANFRIQDNRVESALRILQQALQHGEGPETLHREIMRTYNRLGRRSESVAHYQALAQSRKATNQPLEPETKALYEELIAS